MRQTHFAAAARAPASYANWNDRDILSAVLEGDLPQSKTQDNLLNPVVSRDVRHIVELHDKGEFKSFESIGPSHVALMDLIKFMKSVTLEQGKLGGLLPEVVAQAVRFVKSIPAENIFLRFEVVDKKPSLPEYNPAHICAYDAERAYGSDYLQIARRLTITGTTSSVMNDVDLGTLLESGKKKCAVLYMGTHKDEELTTLGLASQMALNAVITGIEGGQSIEVIEEQVQILIEHPEIAELYAEVAELQVTLTEFKNTLSPEQGKEIVEKLETLTQKIEMVEQIESPLLQEMLEPLAAIIEAAIGEPMVAEMQQILEPAAEENMEEPALEWEDVKEALALIVADQTLSPEVKAEKILALTEQAVPLLLQKAEPKEILVILQDLQNLDIAIQQAEIPVKAPLIQSLAETHPLPLIEPQKLIAIAEVLATPENREILKATIGEGPKLESLISALDLVSQEISKVGVEKGEEKQALLQQLEAALLNPSPETAPLIAAIANLQGIVASPEFTQGMPPALQATMADYSLPILAGISEVHVIGQREVKRDSPTIIENIKTQLNDLQKGIPDTHPAAQEIKATLAEIAAGDTSPETIQKMTEILQHLEKSNPEYRVHDILKSLEAAAEGKATLTPIEAQRDMLVVLSTLSVAENQAGRGAEYKGAEYNAPIIEAILRTPAILEALLPAERHQVAERILPDIAAQLTDNKALPNELRQEIKLAIKSSDPQKLAEVLTKAAPVIAEIAKQAPTALQKTTLINTVTVLRGVAEAVVEKPTPTIQPTKPASPIRQEAPAQPTKPAQPVQRETPVQPVPPVMPPTPIRVVPPVAPPIIPPKPEPTKEPPVNPQPPKPDRPIPDRPIIDPVPVKPTDPLPPEPTKEAELKPPTRPRGRCGKDFCECADPNKPEETDPIEDLIKKYLEPPSDDPANPSRNPTHPVSDPTILPTPDDFTPPPSFTPPEEGGADGGQPTSNPEKGPIDWGGPSEIKESDLENFNMGFGKPDDSQNRLGVAPSMK